MEGKDKKKESIDEILSDLNGLLNKMPSILDGIKMPELQPEESPKPRPEPLPEPAPAQEPPAADADKTVVLPPFPGLSEGEPEPAAAEPAQDGDKTIILQPFAGLGEGAPQPEPEPEAAAEPAAPEALAPQSLGDFMFGQDAEPEPSAGPAKLSGSPLEPPQEKPAAASASGPSLSISEFTPPAETAPAEAPQAALPAFENTRDFGIPDIDALIQMSEGGKAAPELQPADAAPQGGDQPAEQSDGPAPEALPEVEPATDEVNIVENKEIPSEETPGLPQNETGPEPQPQVGSAFDAFVIDSSQPEEEQPPVNADAGGEAPQALPAAEAGAEALSPENSSPMPSADAGAETLSLEPSSSMPTADASGETLNLEPTSPMPSAAAGAETLSFEPSSPTPPADAGGETLRLELPGEQPPAPEGGISLNQEPAAEAGPQFGAFQGFPDPSAGETPAAEPQPAAAPEAGGIELSSSLGLGSPQPAEAGPSGADETLPGGSGVELGGGSTPSGDETLVVAPRGGSGDEEKTVIFQAAPSSTSRAQAGDLESLAARPVPEGIPAERVRSLMFVYSMEDKALCATVLAELDAICLKSATKPMYIKRAAVRECDPDVNPNFLQQSAAECGAQGLVCLGNVPADKVSEIENVVSAANGFFRYYDSSSFSHSAALDLVTDLIVR
ncbi:MAG: hypothetical protein PHV33_04420 [Elusimicrobiales bacterium]|nr:hypothetical protein [Elusimicrobiales bacterium]